MRSYNLGFISDENIYKHVKLTVESYRREITFYKNLFKFVGNDWTVSKNEFDVSNDNLHIYAILIDKITTMSDEFARKAYIRMQSKLLDDNLATCYLVEVNSKRAYNEMWSITTRAICCAHNRIRIISIDKFYELAFNDRQAFQKLCNTLPTIIKDVV